MQEFSLNDTVLVKLSDYGYHLLAEEHNKYVERIPNWETRSADYYKAKADSEGYSRFQWWEFMQKIGKHIGLVSKSPIATVYVRMEKVTNV